MFHIGLTLEWPQRISTEGEYSDRPIVGKVYNIENQDFGDLTEHPGHTVLLKGDLQGDTIKVSSIVMPAS